MGREEREGLKGRGRKGKGGWGRQSLDRPLVYAMPTALPEVDFQISLSVDKRDILQ